MLALLIVIGALIVFKVTGFAIENIKRFLPYEAIQRIPDWHFPAPLGVSFYSFMMISYLVDVYNGRIHAQKNFLKYLSYVLYFHILRRDRLRDMNWLRINYGKSISLIMIR